jgi:hypothetical protein
MRDRKRANDEPTYAADEKPTHGPTESASNPMPARRRGMPPSAKVSPEVSHEVQPRWLLTVKLRGRTEAPALGAEGAQSLRARGAKPQAPHGPLQRLLDGAPVASGYPHAGHAVVLISEGSHALTDFVLSASQTHRTPQDGQRMDPQAKTKEPSPTAAPPSWRMAPTFGVEG